MGARRLAVLLTVGLAAQGCASVKVPLPAFGGDAPAVVSQEREALRAATTELTAALPPETEETRGLRLLVLGGRDDADAKLANAYLADLSGDDPLAAVLADVDDALSRGRRVAEIGRLASTAAQPSRDDVILLEEAITEIQRGRRAYGAVLRRLREEGVPLTRAELRAVEDAFVQTARDIGVAADLCAARADAPHPAQMASDEPGAQPGY